MKKEQDPLDHIQRLLENKSTAKQITYKKLLNFFESLAKEAKLSPENLKRK